jgi:hypothetical protein
VQLFREADSIAAFAARGVIKIRLGFPPIGLFTASASPRLTSPPFLPRLPPLHSSSSSLVGTAQVSSSHCSVLLPLPLPYLIPAPVIQFGLHVVSAPSCWVIGAGGASSDGVALSFQVQGCRRKGSAEGASPASSRGTCVAPYGRPRSPPALASAPAFTGSGPPSTQGCSNQGCSFHLGSHRP